MAVAVAASGGGVVALVVSLAEVGLWIAALADFDFAQAGGPLQYEEQATWFGDLGISYHVGFLGIGLWLAGLAVVVQAAAIAYAMRAGRDRPRAYFGLMLFLTGAIVGVFCAQDLLLFYVFWEAMLIPLYLLVGVWGGRAAARDTALRHLHDGGLAADAGAIIVYGLSEGTFDIPLLRTAGGGSTWLFLGFVVAFAVKGPLFPFHGWLPSAYREAPAEVAGVLSGVVSKAAAYGFLYIAILLFPGPAADLRVPILALAAIGLVYGSLLAFRAPDIRGVIAYSSLAQLGLITLGLFATNLAGWNGALLQMVNHGLLSATLFMLAGLVEWRAGTGRFDRLGGMARGRPALATVLMVTGVIALAVPGSTAFAGEFLILTGVFDTGWGWAVVGAIAIVLAAMYMLRLISAVLHEREGSAVKRRTRPPPRGAGSARAARRPPAGVVRVAGGRHRPQLRPDVLLPGAREPPGAVRVMLAAIPRPEVDWYALAPLVILLGGSCVCVLAAVLLPESWRLPAGALTAVGSFVGAGITAGFLFADSVTPESIVAGAAVRDRLGSFTGLLICGMGLVAAGVAWRHGFRRHQAEYYALLLATAAGMVFLVQATNLMTLFLGLEWFSIALYILCAYDVDQKGSLEAGLKYLVVGGFGSAVLLFGSAFVYGLQVSSAFGDRSGDGAAGPRRRPLPPGRPGDDHRRARVQGVRGAVPHVDAGRLRGRSDTRHGLHGGCHQGGGARAGNPAARRGISRRGRSVDDRAGRNRLRLACRGEPRRDRPDGHQAVARLFVHSAGGIHAHLAGLCGRNGRHCAALLPHPVRGGIAGRLRRSRRTGA